MSFAGHGSSFEEGLRGLVCGTVFGISSPIAGHPLDTWKTLLQTTHTSGSPIVVLRDVVRKEGFHSLYRGLLPPLIGSSVFRSVQFGAYGAAYGAMRDTPALCTPIEWLFGLQPRVFAAVLVSTTARTLIETPLEQMKVRRQVGKPYLRRELHGLTAAAPLRLLLYYARDAYSGLGISWLRTLVALGGFFILSDIADRQLPASIMSNPLGVAAIKGGLCATIAWAAAWPLEVLKNSVQAGIHLEGLREGASLVERGRLIAAQRGGFFALYRGMGPGLLRSLVANGTATLAYSSCMSCWPAPSGVL